MVLLRRKTDNRQLYLLCMDDCEPGWFIINLSKDMERKISTWLTGLREKKVGERAKEDIRAKTQRRKGNSPLCVFASLREFFFNYAPD